jgi:hypothetical protein
MKSRTAAREKTVKHADYDNAGDALDTDHTEDQDGAASKRYGDHWLDAQAMRDESRKQAADEARRVHDHELARGVSVRSDNLGAGTIHGVKREGRVEPVLGGVQLEIKEGKVEPDGVYPESGMGDIRYER